MEVISERAVAERLQAAFPPEDYRDLRILLIVPDNTRTAPLGLIFKSLYRQIGKVTQSFDVLIALGTHQPLSDAAIRQRLEITEEERHQEFRSVHIFNHEWNNPGTLQTIGVIPREEIRQLSNDLFSMDVPVEINRRVFEYDQVIIAGPVFPHEVVGFSGGNKYLFPGISGPQLLNFFHWLGAVITTPKIIGSKWTPVRKVVDRAASLLKIDRRCIAMVVR